MRAAAPGDGDESADALAGTGQSAGTPAPLPGDWAALHGVTMAVGGLNTVLAVAAWYASNIGVLLLNKMLLSYHGFKFPVTLTAIHMIACSVMSYIAIDLFKVVPPAKARSRQQLIKIVVLGSFFCLAVVLGNVSLKFIPVSFNQAIGATTPFFTAVMAFVLQRRREGWVTYLTLVPVVLGVMIATQAEPSFNMVRTAANRVRCRPRPSWPPPDSASEPLVSALLRRACPRRALTASRAALHSRSCLPPPNRSALSRR